MINRTLVIARHCIEDALVGTLMRAYCLMVLLVMGVGWFAAELAVIEQNAFRLAVTAALLRPLAVLVVILQICTGFNEAVRVGQLQLVLSLNLSRNQYLLARVISGSCVAGLIAAIAIVSVAPWSGWEAGLLWVSGLFLELLLMSLFALFVVVTFGNLGAAVLVSLAFYLLCRFIESFVLMATASSTGAVMDLLTGLSWLMPNFGRFSQSSWLIYGDGSLLKLQPLLIETMTVGGVLVLAAMIDFSRREI